MFRLSVLFLVFPHKGRTLLSILGIALGVALGFAVHLINRAAADELAAGVRSLAGEADLEVRGGRDGFPEALYAQLARLPGVAVASPVLEVEAGILGGTKTIRLTGIDPLRAALMQPVLFAHEPGRRLELLKPDAVFLSAAAAEFFGKDKEVEKLTIISGAATVDLEVAGVLPASSLRGIAALTDIATAQWRLGRLGELNRIDLRLAPGVDRAAMQREIEALLPPGVHVATLDAVEASGANLSRAYRVNLDVLALVALFTGGFLVFSAQALEVARRRQEHALLRVLGLERGGVLRLVLAEAAGLGALGGALGVAAGYALAVAAAGRAGRTWAPDSSAAWRRRSNFRWRAALRSSPAASPSRWWARCCRRSTRRMRRRRRRSRRATSSACSPARRACGRACFAWPWRGFFSRSSRSTESRSRATRRSPIVAGGVFF